MEEGGKKETVKKTSTHKICLQQKRPKEFQQWQKYIDNIFSPYGKTIIIDLFYLSTNILKDLFYTLEVIWETS